jgi:chorismate synthase
MAGNSFGALFRFTTWGESHGPAIGVVVDGVPPRLPLTETDIQHWLDKRKPGQSRYTTQRREADLVRIMSGTFDGVTTGTPIQLLIENTDQRSKDYRNIADRFRPGHADYTYWKKFGVRDYRGGGRASARETASRVAAGAVARKILGPGMTIRGALVQIGLHAIDRNAWDWRATEKNPFWCPDAAAALRWADYLDAVRKAGSSAGAVIEVVASGVPAGLGEPVYDKLDGDLARALMTINAVKGVEIGAGFAAAALRGRTMPTRCGARMAGSSFCRTTPAASSAGSRPARTSSRALQSSRPARSCNRCAPSTSTATKSRSKPTAGTTPVSASAPFRSARRWWPASSPITCFVIALSAAAYDAGRRGFQVTEVRRRRRERRGSCRGP